MSIYFLGLSCFVLVVGGCSRPDASRVTDNSEERQRRAAGPGLSTEVPDLFVEVTPGEVTGHGSQSPTSELVKDALKEGAWVIRIREMLISEASSATVALNFFSRRFVVTRYALDTRAPGDLTWYAKSKDGEVAAVLVFKQGDVTGLIEAGGKSFEVYSLGGGLHKIVELREDSHPPDHPSDWEEIEGSSRGSVKERSAGKGQAIASEATAEPVEKPTLRILVVYTPAAKSRLKGKLKGLDSHSEGEVAKLQLGFDSSQVNARVERAGFMEAKYSESGDLRTDLVRIRTRGDNMMDDVHLVRSKQAADIVVLVIDDDDVCGTAKVYAQADSAFAVVHWGCTTGKKRFTFSHEVGHLLGARHNIECDNGDTDGKKYVHGFRRLGEWRTIMSYPCDVDEDKPCGSLGKVCGAINRWSNPRVKYKGMATGTVDFSDNARLLTETIPVAAQFSK